MFPTTGVPLLRRVPFLIAIAVAAAGPAGEVLAGEIHEAAQAGDVARVDSLLAGDPALVNADDGQGTPLHAAIFAGQAAVAKYLLDHGADADAPEPRVGFTPLHLCVYSGNLELGDLLVAAGANIDAHNRMGLSPLDLAIMLGKTEAVRHLVELGADVEGVNGHEHRPLTFAAGRGQSEVVRLLLDAGAGIDAANGRGATAVMVAASAGHDSTVALLLERGARSDVADRTHGRPLLHQACVTGYLSVVDRILDAGAPLDATDADGATALQLAARYGHRQVVERLLSRGAQRPSDLHIADRSRHLAHPPATGAAVAWYLNHRGWAVRTAGRLLVFDAEEFGVTRPADPNLANGFLNAEELTGQELVGLYTCYHGDPGELAYVHELASDVSHATYVHLTDDRFRDGPNCRYLAAGEQIEIDGATIHTIGANTSMPARAYLVRADGVSLFYQGFNVSDPDAFLADTAALVAEGDRVDVAFLPIWEPGDGEAATLQILEELRPRAVCLLDPERREYLFPDFAARLAEAGFDGVVFCAEHPGDHFEYTGRPTE
jgi:ankyrin repeat protein